MEYGREEGKIVLGGQLRDGGGVGEILLILCVRSDGKKKGGGGGGGGGGRSLEERGEIGEKEVFRGMALA